jgi:hypothetical protein
LLPTDIGACHGRDRIIYLQQYLLPLTLGSNPAQAKCTRYSIM